MKTNVLLVDSVPPSTSSFPFLPKKKKMRLMKMLDNDAKIRINMKIKLGWRYSVMLNSKILYDTFAAHGSGGYRGWCC